MNSCVEMGIPINKDYNGDEYEGVSYFNLHNQRKTMQY